MNNTTKTILEAESLPEINDAELIKEFNQQLIINSPFIEEESYIAIAPGE